MQQLEISTDISRAKISQ